MTARPALAPPQPDFSAALNHQIANNLSLLAGLVRLQAWSLGRGVMRGDEVRSVLEEFGGRVETVARLHRLLSDAHAGGMIELGGYLRDITAAAAAALSSPGQAEIRFDCGDCSLPPEKALPLGLIVVELVTNAIKYAHPSGIPGYIAIGCHRGLDGTIIVEVADDGVGLPEALDPMTDGHLGMRLIRLLAAQVGAHISFTSNELGLSFALQMPSGLEGFQNDMIQLAGTSAEIAGARRAAMPDNHYRCYFIDAGDQIKSVEQIACEDDAAAALKAEQLLAASKYCWAELWHGKRLVGKWGAVVDLGTDQREPIHAAPSKRTV